MLLLAVHDNMPVGQIWEEPSRRRLFGKRDRASVLRTFAAQITSLRHLESLHFLYSCAAPGGTADSTSNKKAPELRRASS
jgi:hypothetical protein